MSRTPVASDAGTTTTAGAPPRGERLHPARSDRTYWVLTCLRQELEQIGRRYLAALRDRRPRLVDFGSGDAPYRSLLAPYVGEYIGCDLPGNPAADRVLDQPDVLPFEDRSVDVVLSSQVLEHTVDPGRYLAECARVLDDRGLLVLSTHGVWKYHPDPIDLWRWTSQGLRRSVEQSGLTVVHFRGILGPAAYALQIWQDAVLPRVPWRLRPLFTRLLQGRVRAADRACPAELRDRDAGVFILVATRSPDVFQHPDPR